MPVTLVANLSPSYQTGLALTAKVYAGAALAASVSMGTESPAGSARYAVNVSGLAAGAYQWRAVDASNNSVWTGEFVADGNGNEITLASLPTAPIIVKAGSGQSTVAQAGPIYNPFPAQRYYGYAATRRVADIVQGDSNMGQTDADGLSPSSGHGEAYQRWLCAKYGMGMTTPTAMDFTTNNQGTNRKTDGNGPIAIPAGLPSAFVKYCLVGAGFTGLPSGPWYNPPGGVVSKDQSNILFKLDDQTTNSHGVVDTSEAFTAWFRYGTFPTNPGAQFRPSVRKFFGTGGGATLTADINTATGAYGLADAFITVPATPRSGGSLLLEPTTLFERDWVGEGFIRNAGLIRTNGTTGVTSGCLLYLGGRSTWDCANALLATPIEALAELLRDFAIDQIMRGLDPVFRLRIIEGGNDRNSTTLPSFDPETFAATGPMSNTPTGFYNNNLVCKLRMLQACVYAGFNPDLFFTTYGPYTKQLAYVSDLQGYENAVKAICQRFPRTDWVTCGSMLFDVGINDDMNWPREGNGEDSDDAHWRRAAYHAFAGMAINAEITAAATAANSLTANDIAQVAAAAAANAPASNRTVEIFNQTVSTSA